MFVLYRLLIVYCDLCMFWKMLIMVKIIFVKNYRGYIKIMVKIVLNLEGDC